MTSEDNRRPIGFLLVSHQRFFYFDQGYTWRAVVKQWTIILLITHDCYLVILQCLWLRWLNYSLFLRFWFVLIVAGTVVPMLPWSSSSLASGKRLHKRKSACWMDKSTTSTGPFSSSQSVSHYQRVNPIKPLLFLWFSYGFPMVFLGYPLTPEGTTERTNPRHCSCTAVAGNRPRADRCRTSENFKPGPW